MEKKKRLLHTTEATRKDSACAYVHVRRQRHARAPPPLQTCRATLWGWECAQSGQPQVEHTQRRKGIAMPPYE